MQAIEIKDLTKKFRKVTAIKDMNLRIQEGIIFGLLGPTGAGKTTTVKILSTLMLPTSGRAFVNGFDVVQEPGKVRASLGICLGGERTFYYRLTGKQNLKFFGALQRMPRNRLQYRIDEVLKEVDLVSAKDVKFMKYSAGMRTKLSIARALLMDPPIYLFDEPTVALDPISVRKIREVLKTLRNRKKTIFLTTHNMYEAEQLCNEVAILNKGEVVACSDIENLRKNLQVIIIHIKIKGIEKNLEMLRRSIQKLSSVIDFRKNGDSLEIFSRNKEATINGIIRFLNEYSIHLEDISVRGPNLEDIFIDVVRNKKKEK